MSQDVTQEMGVAYPAGSGGRVSTMALNQAVFADAARATDSGLAKAMEAESNWRGAYSPYVRRLLELGMESPENAIRISTDGLDALRTRLVFRRDDGEGTIDEAMASPGAGFGAATVQASSSGGAPRLSVPYRGAVLSGDSLRRRLDDWVARGITEPSFGEAVGLVVDNPDWLDLSDQTVAVLGAGSEMGPYSQLCDWGALVYAVDLPRPHVWQRVLETARQGRGAVRVPVPAGNRFDGRTVGVSDQAELAEVAGANLVTTAPEVRAWLAHAPGELTVGNYVYADGGVHVRLSEAVDAIMTHLQADRDRLTVAFLATPTDVFSVPWDVVEDARRRRSARRRGLVERPLGLVTGRRMFVPHYESGAFATADPPFGVADNLVAAQGPNYALAKRMQRWRATIARENGATASLNIAPPTRTVSVTKNRAFALAYAGMKRYGIEVFDPPAANALMAAMLVHDLRNPASSAKPGNQLAHPLDLFVDGANPGGMWRCPYEPNSIMTAASLAGLFERRA
jgi:hypothetical protein